MAVKKSIYLDEELDELLKASAERDGRSVTKQIDVLLRMALGQQQAYRNVTVSPPHLSKNANLTSFRGPDPKIKGPSKKRSSKKLR